MKSTATWITCFTVSLILASGNASAGNNRFSGKSGKSSSNRSFNHHGNRNGNFRSNNFSHRSRNSQQKQHSSNQRFSQLKKSSTGQNNYKASFSSKTNNYHFKPTPKQNESDKPNRFEYKKQNFPQYKASRRPITPPRKTTANFMAIIRDTKTVTITGTVPGSISILAHGVPRSVVPGTPLPVPIRF